MTTTQVSEVSISNLALSWVGGNRITSLDDETTEGRICKANYSMARDATIELRNWTFCTKKVKLALAAPAQEVADAHPDMSAFTGPPDMIRVLDICEDAYFQKGVHWSREADYLWVKAESAFLAYLCRVEDPTKYTPNFVHALAARIAMDIAVPVSGSRDNHAMLSEMYGFKLEVAGTMDGLQGKNVSFRDGDLIKVR